MCYTVEGELSSLAIIDKTKLRFHTVPGPMQRSAQNRVAKPNAGCKIPTGYMA